MRHDDLTDNAPGSLIPVPVTDRPGEQAYLPRNLPPDYELSAPEQELHALAREVMGEVRGLTLPELLPDPRILLRPMQREESLRSSSLEGTYATPEELMLYELDPDEPSSARDPRNAWREVHNHDRALMQGEEMIAKTGVSPFLIRSLHQTLLDGVRGSDKGPGQFRTRQVYIGFDRRFIPPPATHVDRLMDSLTDYWDEPIDSLPPIVRAFIFHYQFETIHPFLDGNGRIGRLLLSLMLADVGALTRPWIYLSAFFENRKRDYIDALYDVSVRGDWGRWINLCFEAVITQSRRTVTTCRELIRLRTEWTALIRSERLKPRALALVDEILATPLITVTKAAEVMDVHYNTAKSDLAEMAKEGVLVEKTDAKQTMYVAEQVMRAVHRSAL